MDTPDELYCHRCGASFPAASTQFCPHDGVKLYPATVAARVGQQLDNYNLIDILDAGAMAVVYRAEHAVLGKPMAIKILKDSIAEREAAAERFLREALALSRLEHPNIVDVTDCSTAPDGTPYFVMELLEGSTLEAALAEATALPLYRAVNIVRQIASALVVAHGGGVVHRDLKPANIFLSTREGHRRLLRLADDQISSEREQAFDFVKVIDFGVAKDLEAAVSVHSTQAGLVLGTPAYMAPEQINGAAIDARTDVYALGAVFYELVTGDVPFGGETVLEVLNGHVYGKVEPPDERNPRADVNPGTSAVILRCLEKDPALRYQSAEALCDALVGCFTDRAQVRDVVRMLARRDQQGQASGADRRGRLTDELAELFGGDRRMAVTTTAPSEAAITVEEPLRRRRTLTEELAELFGTKPARDAE